MHHADPWDEISRLEKDMEVELLAQFERVRIERREGIAVIERIPSDRGDLDPQS
jgi:hypothetical protein